MDNCKAAIKGYRRRAGFRAAAEAAVFLAMAGLVSWSAVAAKRHRDAAAPFAAVDLAAPGSQTPPGSQTAHNPNNEADPGLIGEEMVEAMPVAAEPEGAAAGSELPEGFVADPSIRWFNGRPIRPARTIRMTVTAYSPDARSCKGSDDGLTATLHSVSTNGWKLVAADPRVLRYGSMISIPGYDTGRVVPVLDCGGAIKGNRLDVLFPTHEQARRWGVKKLTVTVWEYADGKPAENPRKVR